jgi:hypothetical protein
MSDAYNQQKFTIYIILQQTFFFFISWCLVCLQDFILCETKIPRVVVCNIYNIIFFLFNMFFWFSFFYHYHHHLYVRSEIHFMDV